MTWELTLNGTKLQSRVVVLRQPRTMLPHLPGERVLTNMDLAAEGHLSSGHRKETTMMSISVGTILFPYLEKVQGWADLLLAYLLRVSRLDEQAIILMQAVFILVVVNLSLIVVVAIVVALRRSDITSGRLSRLRSLYGTRRFRRLAAKFPRETEQLILQKLEEGDPYALSYFHALNLMAVYQRRVRSPHWRQRAEAAGKLARLPAELDILDVLSPLLFDEHPVVRETAIQGVANRNDPAAVHMLLTAIEKFNDISLYRMVRHTLANSGPEAVPAIISGILSSKGVVQRLCLDVLSDLKDERALPVMLELAGSSEPETRLRAARALRHYDSEDTLQAVLSLSEDSKWEVRAQAARALGAFQDPRAVEQLRKLAKDVSYWVRNNAVEALMFHGSEGKKVLLELAQGDDPYAADAAKERLEKLEVDEPAG